MGYVDEGGGVLDVVSHQIDEVGAAAEEFCTAGGDGVDSFVGCGGALVGEGVHAETPFAAARTAATMLGYAPQRQRLPLIRSRISLSVSSGLVVLPVSKETVLRVLCLCSLSRATAEQIWPGVQ